MSSVKILAFAGSVRKDSFNKKLVQCAAAGAKKAGAQVTYVDLKDYPMPLFDQDLEKSNGMPENAQKIKKLMIEHDGFLIAAPEYNSSITPLLKNTIDWASRATEDNEPPLKAYKGKLAAIMSASPGALGGLRGLSILRPLLENIGVMVIPDQKAVSKATDVFDDQGQIKDEKTREAVESLGKKLTETLLKLK